MRSRRAGSPRKLPPHRGRACAGTSPRSPPLVVERRTARLAATSRSCIGTADKPGVPFVERLLYGFLAREGLRSDEAQSLTWAHVDLKRGSIRVDVNKTDDPRTWALDPGVVRALQRWKDQQPEIEDTARIFRDLEKAYHLAETLRAHLELAGVTRSELFEKSSVRRPIRIHDLRATFITVLLANGKTEAWIADRTGHTTSAMINRYRRAARTHSELGQGALAPLDLALGLPQQRPMLVSSGAAAGHPVSEKTG
jgi:integrase